MHGLYEIFLLVSESIVFADVVSGCGDSFHFLLRQHTEIGVWQSVFVCVCICMCICGNTSRLKYGNLYLYVCVYVCLHGCLFVCLYVSMYVCNACMHFFCGSTPRLKYGNLYLYTCVCVCIHVCHMLHTYIHTCTYIHTYVTMDRPVQQ
jgi:hypothetical protein